MPVTAAPRLETARLVLSAHKPSDHADCTALWADPAVVRFIGGRVSTAEETWSRLLRYAGLWALLGLGYWVVREAASGRFVGEAGLADFQRELTPSFGDAPEAGWALAPWAQGRGYASEAVGALLAWNDARAPGRRVVCMIAPQNAPSLRVAERCGFRPYAQTDYKGAPTLLLERFAPGARSADAAVGRGGFEFPAHGQFC